MDGWIRSSIYLTVVSDRSVVVDNIINININLPRTCLEGEVRQS